MADAHSLTALRPMLATAGPVPVGPGWAYEVKWDGMRVLGLVSDSGVRLVSRNGHDKSRAFPEVAGRPVGTGIPAGTVLDGELVALDDAGVPSFALLAPRFHQQNPGPDAAPVTWTVFDVLVWAEESVVDRPWTERRELLETIDYAAGTDLSAVFDDGPGLLTATAAAGLEGVVAKRRSSPYRSGRRSPDWVKAAHRSTTSAVVLGWRSSADGPDILGSLILGLPSQHGWLPIGSVGAGLVGAPGRRVADVLRPLATHDPPAGLDVAALPRGTRDANWLQPVLVVDIEHLGRTEGAQLRQPVFRGIRTDLDVADLGVSS